MREGPTLRAARPDKEFEMGEMDFQPLPKGARGAIVITQSSTE